MPSYSGVWSLPAVYQAVASLNWPGSLPTRGLFGGGEISGVTNAISYITLETTGNATDFGDLTVARRNLGALSSSTRGVWGGGNNGSSNVNVMDYITISSTGNAVDFGDTVELTRYISGSSNSTRGIWAGGVSSGNGNRNTIEYITIASTGNALDFGDLPITTSGGYGALASPTRAVFAGPDEKANEKKIYYVTIASTGNAASFGDLNTGRTWSAGASNATRGLFAGGYNNDFAGNAINAIDYITIATEGNATDFGDLTVARYYLAGCASSSRAVFAGGNPSTNVMDYVTITSTGNATDFGDMLAATSDGLSGCSNGHGGLA